MTVRKGAISVNTKDILPIIKKWLYSEHDIFLRELIANATDAIRKRSQLVRLHNWDAFDPKIEVLLNPEAKTIQIIDNGIGMSEEEVEKYIAQVAFSGAEDFISKMKAAGNDVKNDIIGKFGLGFYSAFMVADKVEVDTLSANPGATPVKWICAGDTDYEFSESTQQQVGTVITLHINEENKEFLERYKLRSTLTGHCDFMPYPIFLNDLSEKPSEKAVEAQSADDEAKTPEPATPKPINNTDPIWKKDPASLKDEDYLQFFRTLFPMDSEPLFWLHLNVDHPFTLDGILYFPKVNLQRPFHENNIKLYCKQVFVSDNVKNIIPDFLSLLKGAIDSTDIPLNVSRSSLQGDPNVKKLANYIVKKVAEALKKLFKNDREKYEKIWKDIGLFVKYGCVSDTKFDEAMREMVIFKNTEGKFVTLSEYRASIPSDYKEKMGNTVIYFDTSSSDTGLKKQLQSEGISTIEIDNHIDPHFLQHVEYHKQGEQEYKFSSVDAQIENILSHENTDADDVKIQELFQKMLTGEIPVENAEKKETPFSNKLQVEIKKIKNSKTPAYLKVDEQMKRFASMSKAMGQENSFPLQKTLVVNPQNSLVKNALRLSDDQNNGALVEKICHYIQDLATISSQGLGPEQRDEFVARSQQLMEELTHKALHH